MISSCTPYIHFIVILSTFVLLLFSLVAILIVFYETYNYYRRVFFTVITILITVYDYVAIFIFLSGNYLSCSQRLKVDGNYSYMCTTGLSESCYL